MRPAWWLRYIGLAAVALTAAAPAAHAQKAEDTLRIVWWDQIGNLNPYYNRLRVGLMLAHQVFDGLVDRDPETFAIRPLLATSWKQVDDTTLDLDLRRGVRFHDGSAFSADDVVYTITTLLHDRQVAVPSNYAWIAGAEKLDDYTVRLRLRRVFPAATEYMAMVLPILPRAYRERVGMAAFDRQPVGAGPYRIAAVDGKDHIELDRFDDYYTGGAKARPAIRRLAIHQVGDAIAARNEMVRNEADWTYDLPPEDADRLAALPYLQTVRAETMRVSYLQFDAAGRSGAGNPLTHAKVRQAIAYAIDRQAIARDLMRGNARVPDAPCYPTQFGCDASSAVRYGYDPARARVLLAEAGYPDGFPTEIVSFLLPQYEAAVQGYLKAVGINARVTHLQIEAAIRRNNEGTAPIFLTNWGSYSINDVSAFLPQLFDGAAEGYGAGDDARDPETKRLVQAGGDTTSPDERRRAYGAAIRRATEQMYVLPITTGVATYAARREVAFKAYPDELPRFHLMTWR